MVPPMLPDDPGEFVFFCPIAGRFGSNYTAEKSPSFVGPTSSSRVFPPLLPRKFWTELLLGTLFFGVIG